MLLNEERFASALCLSILAIEEAEKVSIPRGILAAATDKDIKELWRDYRSHRAKNVAWILPDLVGRGARTLLSLRGAADKEASHTALADTLKQVGFYTDFVAERHWSEPVDVITKELASSVQRIAGLLVSDREVSEEENTLGLKHLGPESKYGLTQRGLAEFFAEAIDSGLSTQDHETIKTFVFGGAVAVEE